MYVEHVLQRNSPEILIPYYNCDVKFLILYYICCIGTLYFMLFCGVHKKAWLWFILS